MLKTELTGGGFLITFDSVPVITKWPGLGSCELAFEEVQGIGNCCPSFSLTALLQRLLFTSLLQYT